MRGVCMLVIACLVAATSMRSLHIERRDPHAPHVEVAPVAWGVVARREAPQISELRLAPFVCAAAPIASMPQVRALSLTWQNRPVRFASPADTPCARGPPTA